MKTKSSFSSSKVLPCVSVCAADVCVCDGCWMNGRVDDDDDRAAAVNDGGSRINVQRCVVSSCAVECLFV